MSSSSSRAACHAVNEQQAKYPECCNGQALLQTVWNWELAVLSKFQLVAPHRF